MEIFNRDHSFPTHGSLAGLPPQAIATRKKDKKWKEDCLDALEMIGLRQYEVNAMYDDYYLMADGKLSFMELADVIPQLKDVQKIRSDIHIPSFLKHYDIIGGIVNAFEGWLTNLQDKYTVNEVGDLAISEYEEAMSTLVRRNLQEKWDMILNQKLLEAGLDPEYNNFETEEQRQAYAQQIASAKESMTPDDIKSFMTTRWKTQASYWGDHTLESDRGRFYMDDMDRENFRDYLLTGKMFRNHFVGFDYYRPEVWSAREVFHPVNDKYPQYGSYIGRVHFFEGTDLIARYGHKMTAKQKREIMGGEDTYNGWSTEDGDFRGYKKRKFSLSNMYENEVIPWRGYHDYKAIVNAEDYFGVPMGEYRRLDADPNAPSIPRFMPRFHPFGYFNSPFSTRGNDIINPRLYRAVEAYWVSMKPIYLVTYQTETGLVTQEIVTDELLKDFLKENGIKKMTRVMDDAIHEPEVNTYVLEYVPEVRFGVKITGGNLFDRAIYIGGDPIPHQIHGDSSLYDYIIPVAGFVGPSLVDRIQPYQMLYNLAMNQLYNVAEKEIGKFFLGDLGFIPSEYKDMVDKKGALATFMQIVKSVSFMGVGGNDGNDPYRNPQMSSIYNQFGVYDLTNTDQLRSRMEIASYAYQMAYRMIGISEQAIGQSTRYETSTGVKQGVNATMLQTQIYFNNFDSFKKRCLDIHLATAQVCQKEGYDWTVMYRNSDLSLVYVNLSDKTLSLRHLNVLAVANSKKRLELESMKQYILQTNTLGNDLLDLTRMMSANSSVEMNQIARDARAHAEEIQNRQFQQQQQLQQQQAEAERAAREDEYQKEKELVIIKGEYDLRGKSLTAAGQAARTQDNAVGMDFVKDMADRQIKQEELDTRRDELSSRERMADADRRSREEIERRKLELKEKEIEARNKRTDTDRFTSIINKN